MFTWTRVGYPQLPPNAIVEGNTLTISDLKIEDRGQYTVTVTGPGGARGSAEAELRVKRGRRLVDQSRVGICERPISVGVCPYVWVEPVNAWRGQPGERVEFHCKAIGEPTPRLYWARADGRPLDNNAHVSIQVGT